MSPNIGTVDRAARVVGGAALIALALLAPETPYSYLGWIGVVPIITAFVGYCPFYSILSLKTN